MRPRVAQRGTLCPYAGGRLLFSRQSPKDESNVGEKLPELFDIHVMFFADTSSAGIAALQKAFGLERAVAEQLVSEVPVMVKRAASPAVADSLLDVLNGLGAQVVLLPSTATPSIVPDDSSAGLLNAGWGGLDLKLPAELKAAADREALPAVAFLHGGSDSGGIAQLRALSEPPLPVVSAGASLPPPASIPARMQTPIPVPVRAEAGGGKAAESDDTPYAERFALDDRTSSLELAHLETTPRVFPTQPRARGDMGEASAADSLELDLAEGTYSGPGEGLAAAGRGAPEDDLGLGSVPPLPSAAKPGPPRLPDAKPAAAVAARAGARPPAAAPAAERRIPKTVPPKGLGKPSDAGRSAVLPDLELAVPDVSDPYWAAKRRTAPASATAATSATSSSRPPYMNEAASERARQSLAASLAELPTPRSRAIGAVALLTGGLMMAAAVRFDALVFTGSASLPWTLLQGLAFFAIGAGLVRLRR